jgi:hypothetical protein
MVVAASIMIRFPASDFRGYIEVVARKDFVEGMHVWSFADFAVV